MKGIALFIVVAFVFVLAYLRAASLPRAFPYLYYFIQTLYPLFTLCFALSKHCEGEDALHVDIRDY